MTASSRLACGGSVRRAPARRALNAGRRTVGAALLLAAALLLWFAPVAAAGTALDHAAAALSSGQLLYVDPSVAGLLGSQENEIRSKAASTGTQVYVAALPQSEVDAAGSGADLVQQLARKVNRPGTYLAVTPRGLFGISDVLDNATVIDTVRTAARQNASAGPALVQALEGIASISSGSSPPGFGSTGDGASGGIGPGTVILLVLVLAGAATALLAIRSSRRRRMQQAAQAFAEVRTAAAEDVTRMGEDITGLDLDLDSPEVDDATRGSYAASLDAYDAAKEALDRAHTVHDLAAVSAALEDGRYNMECVRARIAGRPLPERRPPCFFNPQHGPSVRDVEWAPPGGAPRPVPACGADADRVLRGQDPDARQVVVGGARRPYWEAGPAYAPWAGGYYGGGMGMGMGGILPGLLIGTMLGGAMNPGWQAPGGFAGGWDEGGGFGGGGGDFGGGGGGDFGGGGGGDFGGGGGDFGGGGGDFGGGGGGDFSSGN